MRCWLDKAVEIEFVVKDRARARGGGFLFGAKRNFVEWGVDKRALYVDKDASTFISYVEFNKYIYHSPKHSPDSFRKADKDNDGVFDTAEFVEALSKVSWWKLSRKTPYKWFIQADKNMNRMLDIKEFAWICTSGNHIANIFKRTDRDESDSLTQRETEAYIRSVTHGR